MSETPENLDISENLPEDTTPVVPTVMLGQSYG
jgi:hypothetical protein